MLRPNALRPRMDIDVGAMRRVMLRPCRGCGSPDHHCLFSPSATVRCNACRRVTSVRKPPPLRRVAVPRPSLRVRSTPRPRSRCVRVVAAGGRNGDGARDDGSGDDDGPPSRPSENIFQLAMLRFASGPLAPDLPPPDIDYGGEP